mmetsp:Transcript_10591/g.28214  ORF Transcript_10591/g.28214 Transcript_10591/m.28214 type:complete len:234 (+) Transcript_10591:395-1096(+)
MMMMMMIMIMMVIVMVTFAPARNSATWSAWMCVMLRAVHLQAQEQLQVQKGAAWRRARKSLNAKRKSQVQAKKTGSSRRCLQNRCHLCGSIERIDVAASLTSARETSEWPSGAEWTATNHAMLSSIRKMTSHRRCAIAPLKSLSCFAQPSKSFGCTRGSRRPGNKQNFRMKRFSAYTPTSSYMRRQVNWSCESERFLERKILARATRGLSQFLNPRGRLITLMVAHAGCVKRL